MLLAHHVSARLLAGNSHPALADLLARELDMPLITPEVAEFADGETRIHIAHDVRGAHVFVVQPTCTPVNDNLMNLALLADAAHAAAAIQVTAIVPYFGYARQDQRSRSGDPRSAQVAGRLLAAVGVNHLVTLDLHSPALESAMPMPVTMLHADDVFVARIKTWGIPDLLVVSPDAGGMKRAQRYAEALETNIAVITKQRREPDVAKALQVLGEVRDHPCLIADDMASTGRTLAAAADALRRAGASDIYGIFTHAVLAPGAEDRLIAARFKKLLTSDSIPMRSKLWLEVVPTAPLIAEAVRFLTGPSQLDAAKKSDESQSTLELETAFL